MNRFAWVVAIFLLWPSGRAVLAATVPGRYIVELTTEPVAEHVARQARGEGVRSAAASAHRTQIRREQQQMRQRIGQQATVVDSTDTVANTLLVEASEAQAAQLASVAGVRRVYPVRTVHMLLDRAAVVTKATQAWDAVGVDRAGAGVKIAIIDSGIDTSHPGFQDSSLAVPDSFPKVNSSSDVAYTNSKVIVARSYVNLLSARDPDRSARDRVGHGTALAMVAAGVRSTGPLATIMGIAPKAYLGNYKVFGTPGFNDDSSDDIILKAMDDAVADGMDIISLSLGSDLAPRLDDDPAVQAVERASRAGVLVVVAAGNNGPDLNTMSSPATAPSAIAVGASSNDRTFAVTAEVAGLPPFAARLGDGKSPSSPVTGSVVDVATLDGTGLACTALPPGSLDGQIALILRGTCTFETKLNNAQQAGAAGALVYAAQDSPSPISMGVGAATLPAEMIAYQDGAAIKNALAAGALTGTLRFAPAAMSIDSNRLADFSAAGPNVDTAIKPDLVAVGADMYVATQTFDPNGDMYDPTGYLLVDGTSFSTPLVAGAAALVKSARPGLTVDQYRSLIINGTAPLDSVPGTAARVQQAGAGLLDVAASVRATATAYPAALNFGGGSADPNMTRTLTVTNVGAAAETFTVLVAPRDDGGAPAVATNTLQLAPGASADVTLTWDAAGLAPGPHEGFVRIVAASTGTEARVPYWYAVLSDTPAHVTVLSTVTTARRGALARDAILFRVTDASGLPLANARPEVTISSGDATVSSIVSHDSDVPGTFGLNLRLGVTAGSNVVHIQAGDASVDVTIAAR